MSQPLGGWEITLISEDRVMAIILLRRQWEPLVHSKGTFGVEMGRQDVSGLISKINQDELLDFMVILLHFDVHARPH